MKDFQFSALDYLDDGQVFGVPLAGRIAPHSEAARPAKKAKPAAKAVVVATPHSASKRAPARKTKA